MISVASLTRAAKPVPAQEQRPAVAAQREAEVVDDEGREHEDGIRAEDQLRNPLELVPVQADEGGDDRERDGDRDDRPGLAEGAGPAKPARR